MKSKIKAVLFLILIAGGFSLFPLCALADWTYTVQRGDTLYTVGRKCGVTAQQILQRNGLSNDYLRIGQRITIPTDVTASNGNGDTAPTRVSGDAALLAHLIFAEAGSEPYVGQVAVGAVVMNRIQNPKFPKSIPGVVYQPSAFESVSNGIINNPPSEDAQKAARDAIAGWDPSGGALYFFNPAKTTNAWIWARQIINRIGKHVFSI